jgi:uncharacterized membrane protein
MFYRLHGTAFFLALLAALVVIAVFLFVRLVGKAFGDIGFSPLEVALLLGATLFGSFINIPLARINSRGPVIEEGYIRVYGIVYRVPRVKYGTRTTMLAVNVGGALIPTIVSLYILWRTPSTMPYALLGVAVVAAVTYMVARPVRGVGITAPALLSPLVAALVASFTPLKAPYVVAYVSGVLGTLIGADILNLGVIPELGAPVASIGGAGTFDGVFLSGIIAVLLA